MRNNLRLWIRVLVIGFLVPRMALAQAVTPPVQPDPELKLTLKSDFAPQVAMVDNINGVWFPVGDADYLLYLRDIAPKLDQLRFEYATQNKLLMVQLDSYKQISGYKDGMTKLTQDQLTKTEDELTKCREEQKSIWNSPLFIGSLSFVAGVLLTTGIVYAVRK